MEELIEKIGIEYLNECFDIDFQTGIVKWKKRPFNHFNNIRVCNSWNSRFAYKNAGTIQKVSHLKYYSVCINNKLFLLHRICYYFYHNTLILPNGSIGIVDHINGNGLDNSIINLRLVDSCLNNRNTMMFKNNTSGFKGINWHKNIKKWQVNVKIDKKKIYLGSFDNIEDAIKVRREYEGKYNYINR